MNTKTYKNLCKKMSRRIYIKLFRALRGEERLDVEYIKLRSFFFSYVCIDKYLNIIRNSYIIITVINAYFQKLN